MPIMPTKKHRSDPDNPPLTAADFARARRFPGDLPAPAAAAIRRAQATRVIRRRGPNVAPTKVAISIRVSRAALEAYRATGRGWQTRLNAAIEQSAQHLPRGGRPRKVSS